MGMTHSDGSKGAVAAIDWSRPWLRPWRAVGEPLAARVLAGASVAEALNDAAPDDASGQAAVRFVAQSALPPGEPYERHIFRTRSVPTRDNLHDFFNGLCWLQYPATKARLNALQAAEIAAQGVQPQRGRVRDALTVFDENAAFLLAPPALWQALGDRAWRRAFVDLRPLWAGSQVLLFGHALLEKLVQPRKPITAHVYCALSPLWPLSSAADVDAAVAAELSAERLAGKPFIPLPVLGVPGWWDGNEHDCFYDDALVFRPRRATTTSTTPGAT